MSVELHPELKGSLEHSRSGLTFIRHPLLVGIYVPELAATMNKTLEVKKEACEEALRDEDYEQYIWLHERPYRAEAFARVEQYLPRETARIMLRAVWVDAENPGINRGFFLKRFKYHREKDAYGKVEKAVGGVFKLYRGYVGLSVLSA